MKYGIIFLVMTLFNCSTNTTAETEEDQKVVGKWKIIEQLADPGDGSGTFSPIESERTIEFFSDGTVRINGVLCFMSSEVRDQETGSYMLNTDSNSDFQFDGEIIPNVCSSRSARVYFDLPVSGQLILWYPCIEGCAQKFVRM